MQANKPRFLRPFTLLACGLAILPMAASGMRRAAAAGRPAETVVMQIALVRHGIRAPIQDRAALRRYSAEAWPAWPVAGGDLTRHGARMMRSLGAWYRKRLVQDGLLDPDDCAELRARVRVVANSFERTRQSAAALVEGMAPHCDESYDALPTGHPDPLFDGVPGPAVGAAEAAYVRWKQRSALRLAQSVLLGCAGSACVRRARANGTSLLRDDDSARSAITRAGNFAEIFMLEYAQGMPLSQVGWGTPGVAGVKRLIVLQDASVNLGVGSLARAGAHDGNLLAHIAATLAAGAGRAHRLRPLLAAGQTTLVLVGHDGNLAAEARLLGVDWHDPRWPDDYPPGGMLIYQLLRDDAGRYRVRIHAALPTLAGLRAADVDAPDGLRQVPVHVPGCDRDGCRLSRFEALVAAVVPSATIVTGSGNEPAVKRPR